MQNFKRKRYLLLSLLVTAAICIYTTVNILRMIEDLLGIDYSTITDANAKPRIASFQADRLSLETS